MLPGSNHTVKVQRVVSDILIHFELLFTDISKMSPCVSFLDPLRVVGESIVVLCTHFFKQI